jgi:hypothetical protein
MPRPRCSGMQRRHQVLLATLAEMTVGVAVFGSVLAINRNLSTRASANTDATSSASTPAPTPTLSLTDGSLGAVRPDALRYTR